MKFSYVLIKEIVQIKNAANWQRFLYLIFCINGVK